MPRVNLDLREPTYEAVVAGEEIGTDTVVADDHYIKQAAFALDDDSAWSTGNSAHPAGRLVPPGGVIRDLVAHFCKVYDPSRVVGLHQREEVWLHAPIPEGTVMHYTGRYIEKFERRGKGYVVFESEARDESGKLLLRQVSTEIMRVPENVQLGEGSAAPPVDRIDGVWPTDIEPVAKASLDLAPGTPIVPLVKTAHQDQMAVFSGINKQYSNIHTDLDVAESAGFPDTIAQGAMETCWTSEMLGQFFGESWLTSGWIKHVYLKPVFRGDTITLRGVVKAIEDDEISLEVWAENQSGVMTAAGWAKGKVR
jgi:acyl dehydratase